MEGYDVIFEALSSMLRKFYYESASCACVPRPADDNVALEPLRLAKSKRVMSTHVFVVPKLFCTLSQC